MEAETEIKPVYRRDGGRGGQKQAYPFENQRKTTKK